MTPSNETRSRPRASRRHERLLWLALRLAVGVMFVTAGLAKLLAQAQTIRVLAARGLPEPALLALAVGAGEVLGGLLLMTAWKVRWVAAALASFVVVATLLIHFPMTLVGPRAFELGVDACVLLALYAVASKG